MAKVRNVSGEERFVPWLDRLVDVDEVVEVPDENVESFTCQPGTWASESLAGESGPELMVPTSKKGGGE